MWTKLAHVVLKYRLLMILLVAGFTAFMGYQAQKIELAYNFSQVVPEKDPDMQAFREFRRTYGEDGNVLAIGLRDSAVYTPENFRRLRYLANALRQVRGVQQVVALPDLMRLERDSDARRFRFVPHFAVLPDSQAALDSLLGTAFDQRLYEGRLFNQATGATSLLVTIESGVLNSEARLGLIDDIRELGRAFTEKTNIELHYAGLPYARTVIMQKVKRELNMFLIISLCVTAVILFTFFRSWKAVVFPMIVIGVVVVSVMGTVVLLGFQITMLTGLLPPIIVVIGIPNCVYLLNKYHQEFAKHGNKMKALSYIIRKIGVVTLLTNATTAVGFAVLIATDIAILREFGLVASLNVFVAFLVSIVLIPAIFAYLPPPNPKQLKHLDFRLIGRLMYNLDLLVHRHPIAIFVSTGIIIVISLIGMSRLQAIAYLVDDLPEESAIKQDMLFFEENFGGVMPFEVVLDTQRPRGALDLKNLRIAAEIEDSIGSLAGIAPPLSAVQYLKSANQAFYNGDPEAYRLPSSQARNTILTYLQNQRDSDESEGAGTALLNAFVDSTGQRLRLSFRVADMGSVRIDRMMEQDVRPMMARLLEGTGLEATVTGTTLIFIKGNDYLIKNLQTSLLIAVVAIALVMAALFGNFRMIVISLIPNIIPLLITAGLMGYLGIPLKPSTALVFSIAFGISVDDSIHFLAKYRQELRQHRYFVSKAVSISIKETGTSMLYTSIILFAGFITFVWSEFGGTVALGLLTSITLLCAMLTNLIVLPALLLVFDTGRTQPDFAPLIEHYEEFYTEDEDEEIDRDLLEITRDDNASAK